MKKIAICVVLIITSLLFANQALDEQSIQEVRVSPCKPELRNLIEKMDQAKANGDVSLFKNLLDEYRKMNQPVIKTDGPQVQLIGPEPTIGSGPQPFWSGVDVTVDSAWDYQAFSMDTRSNGTIFLAASRRATSGDDYVVSVWASSNGVQWNWWLTISWTGHDIINPSIKVVEQSDSDYFFVMFNSYDNASPHEEDIIVLRHPFGTGTYDFYNVSTNTGVPERNPSLDADDIQFSNAPYLYCAFESGDSIAFIRSLDIGLTWVDRQILREGDPTWDYDNPECTFGWHNSADSFTIGVAWHYRENTGAERIRFRRCISYGAPSGWLPVTYFPAPTNHLDRKPSLKMTHGTMPSGAIIFARCDTVGNDEEDLCIFYTYNGGRSWTNDTLYLGGEYAVLNCLSVDDSPRDYHAFFKGDYDDIRYKEGDYDNLSYDGWTFSIAISDGGDISEATSPASAVFDTMPCVCWKDITNSIWYKIKFDALWLQTGIQERQSQRNTIKLILAPNPSNGNAKIFYQINKSGNVRISVYDASGRLVNNLINEKKPAGTHTLNLDNRELPNGIYFVRVETPEGTATKTMTIVR
ncbi:MAG: T9SS type A sorting domain-containing protein [candidate division WOR-3 bacterium]